MAEGNLYASILRMLAKTLASLLFCGALLMTGCTVRTTAEVQQDLWSDWEQIDHLLQRDYPDAVPLVLLHGWNGDEFTWPKADELIRMEHRLGRDIFFYTYRTGLMPYPYPPIEVLEEQLDLYLSQFRKVDVVAHSMGGLLVRQLLRHHPEVPLRRVVFLSTPHFGTYAANVLVGLSSVSSLGNAQAQEMQPGSDFLWQLNSLNGAELEGVSALNVYVEGNSIAEFDIVVDPGSAYLPWVPNVSVAGDHHTLAERLTEFDFIFEFLNHGKLPKVLAKMPTRRDLWVRISNASSGEPVHITDSAVTRFNENGAKRNTGFAICCKERTAMFEEGRHTLVIENLQVGESVQVLDRHPAGSRTLDINASVLEDRPVTLKSYRLN